VTNALSLNADAVILDLEEPSRPPRSVPHALPGPRHWHFRADRSSMLGQRDRSIATAQVVI
jgi:hypothetical protein